VSFLRELWNYTRARKKFWLLPMLITLLFFGILLIVGQSSAIAPFIYTLF
jgi:uncharacterized protein DUF5989